MLLDRCGRCIRTVLCVASLVCAATAGHAQGLALPCGVAVTGHLAPGAIDTYQFAAAPGAAVVMNVADASGGIGLLKLHVSDVDETCSGTLKVTSPGSLTVQVSDCIGTDSGDYTITATVVSGGADNCGQPMPCGLVPYVRRFNVPGQVDAYAFQNTPGDRITLKSTDSSGTAGSMRVRLFDPDGLPVSGGDSCGGALSVVLPKAGTYTALLSTCSLPKSGLYFIAFRNSVCPAGPEITSLGIIRADGVPVPPTTYDDFGRPLYRLISGGGIFVVVEARPGTDGATVGRQAYEYDPNDPTVLPDLQVLLGRDLGNGSAAVCDNMRPRPGGIPATVPLEFVTTQAVADAINDLGCRFDDGTGHPLGNSTSLDACSLFPDGTYHFIDPTTTMQFCGLIAGSWAFPPGDTIVAARVRSIAGNVGAPRQMVVSVVDEMGTPFPTFTATPTATRTSSGTPTSTRTAVPPTTTFTRTATLSPTNTSVPTATRTPPPTRTSSATPTSSRTSTPTRTSPPASPTNTATHANPTHTPTPTASQILAATLTATPTGSKTPTPSSTPATILSTSTPTRTPSATGTLAATSTAISTGTPTLVPTSSATMALIATATATPRSSATAIRTPSATATTIHSVTATATQAVINSETPTSSPTPPPSTATATATHVCAGDCNGDGEVTVNEIIVGVNIALGVLTVDSCLAMDVNGDGTVTVNELLLATRHNLNSCAVP